jgi:hypothetical protein
MFRIFIALLFLLVGVLTPALADVWRFDACPCCDEVAQAGDGDADDDGDCCDDGLCACCSAPACVTPPPLMAVRERGALATQQRPPGSPQSVIPRATSPPPVPPPIS